MLKFFRDVTLGATFIAFVAVGSFLVRENIPPAKAQPLVLGPNYIVYSAVTAAQQIIGANPSRHALQICNPGSTNALWILPTATAVATGFANNTTGTVSPAANVGFSVPPVASNVVNCFSPPLSAPSLGQAWSGFSTTTPVVIFEWP
ncbi:MAG TPA: hypothetical protein VKB67_01990 [Rhizomicrobium sp.]|nr:hypothetical protein [Rhizomicrobium sp.]